MTVDEEYSSVVECTYKERRYLVRDNGAILRLPMNGRQPSKYDNVWTFGVKDKVTGYMLLASSVRVHRVVATAFHGAPEGAEMVVDHKDTNRCNNRPENLRWVTRLENVLENEATRKKIAFLCGSLQAFIDNPSIIREKALPRNFEWMRTVTKAEAEACKTRIEEWAKRDSVSVSSNERTSIDESIFKPIGGDIQKVNIHSQYPYDEIKSYYWQEQNNGSRWECRVFSHTETSLFPSAPFSDVPAMSVMDEYRRSLTPGSDYLISRYYKLIVNEVVSINDNALLRVLAERPNSNRTYVFEISFNGVFIAHRKIGSFSKKNKGKAYDVLNNLDITGWIDNSSGRTYHTVLRGGVVRIS